MANDTRSYNFTNQELFKNIPAQIKLKLEEKKVRKKAAAGKLIYREGTFAKGIYIIKRGKVKIYQTSREGKEQIMYIYSKGEIMGYRPLICDSPHPVSAAALEECSYEFIPGTHFMKILDSHPALVRELLKSLSHEFTVWVNTISVFAQQPVKERIALALVLLQEKYIHNGLPADINLSREDFANYTGTVKETLVRVLQEFKKNKIVTTQGRRIRIINMNALKKIASLS